MEGWLIFIAVIVGIWFISWINSRLSGIQKQAKKYVELKPKLDSIETYRVELETREARLKGRSTSIEILLKEKTQGFPWLAKAYVDYINLQDEKKASNLKLKSHPA